MFFSSILLGTGLAQLSLAAYNIKDDYSADNFASMFRFDTVSLLLSRNSADAKSVPDG